MTFCKSFLMALAVITLTACTSFMPRGGQSELQSQLAGLDTWQVRGKLSVTSPDDTVTGYLTWEQHKQTYDLFISGPFGSGASRLSGSKNKAELTLPGWDNPEVARSPEQLMQTHMGWNFPVSDIRYWVKGQPSPANHADTEYDANGLLSTLRQHGWEVKYSRYQQQNGYWLPGLIKISGYNFRFIFSIKEWTLNG
ncbi:lipoprotein insertase outer membrane protein LolB [Thalassolituus sp. LLYu03]|uniref:lipoprotein insertase outer membrane protein LolB n=1 Tax=Thalassolituus sp. LLYu03 TaxID=3421656 RepID=UPI003D2ADBCB